MNKKYYILIAVLSVLLAIIIGLISVKSIKIKNNTNDQDNQIEKQEKTYTGNIRCEIEDKNDDIYETYFIENIEVEENIVKTNETKRKIKYKNADTYTGFKENEEVLNPIYDDENLTIEYTFYEKKDLPSEEVDVYIKNLTDNGYKCEKVID